MTEFFKKIYRKYYYWIITLLIVVIVALIAYFNYKLHEKDKKIDEIEIVDTTGTYHKVYYEKKFKELKKENKELYDSLKHYKDKISYLVQFSHEKEYNTGEAHVKPVIKDSIVNDTGFIKIPNVYRTYEYTSEENDTFQYKLSVNSLTQPNWYNIKAKVKNKFTIVNKEDGNGMNHITIGSETSGDITDVTVFKKKEKRKFVDRLGIGPAVTAGYDPINRNFGIMVGVGITYDLK